MLDKIKWQQGNEESSRPTILGWRRTENHHKAENCARKVAKRVLKSTVRQQYSINQSNNRHLCKISYL